MDFCVSEKQYPRARGNERTSFNTRNWKIVWHPSGNIEQLRVKDAPVLFVGTVMGDLRNSKGLKTGDAETLANDALDSNGSFAVVIPGEDDITVVTDAGGSIPICWGQGPKGAAVGTRVHEVAGQCGLETLDEVSAVDFLMHGTICYPFTWFEGLQLLPPGSVCRIHRDGMEVLTYWKPTEPENIYGPCDVDTWAKRLRSKVATAIQGGVKDAGKVRVFFSGGNDSRAVTSLVPDEATCVLTTVLDSPNREYRLAKRAAWALSRPLEWIPRPEGYYRKNIIERISSIGPGWDFRNVHFTGEISDHFNDSDVALGGYLADTLFKTYYMSNVEQRRGWRRQRLHSPDPDKISILQQNVLSAKWFREDLRRGVVKRRNKHHERLKSIRPMTAGNWHGLWPLSNLRAYAQYLGELRMGPRIVEPFLFHKTYQLASRIPDTCRVDNRVFRRAFAREMGMAGWLPVSYGGVPRLGGNVGELLGSLIGRARLVRQKIAPSTGTQGPWTSDHHGWAPVKPSNHFGEKTSMRLMERLSRILADDREPYGFLCGTKSHGGAAVRALCLGWNAK